jgi:hypothetical protein
VVVHVARRSDRAEIFPVWALHRETDDGRAPQRQINKQEGPTSAGRGEKVEEDREAESQAAGGGSELE